MQKILILTHTNPIDDPRIMKTRATLSNNNSVTMTIGLLRSGTNQISKNILLINLLHSEIDSKKYSFKGIYLNFLSLLNLLTILRFIEVTIKLVLNGIKFNPNIIHCNDWVVLPSALIIKILTKSKLVYDAHELESETQQLGYSLKLLVKSIEKISWPQIDYFITVSPSIADWYLQKYGFKPFEIILNTPKNSASSIDSNLDNKNNYFRNIFNIPISSKIYLYIGNLDSGRGINLLLEAFSKLESKSYIIFLGSGKYQERIQKKGIIHSNILFHPKVPYETLTSIASSGDFGLCFIEDTCLSYRYSLPNKLFEYVFSGLIVLASDLPEIRSFIEKYSLGECIDSSVESIVYWVDKIGNNKSLSRNNGDTSIDELRWEVQSRKLIKIYSQFNKNHFIKPW